jgi:beta-barrel assembly-enhancing protease
LISCFNAPHLDSADAAYGQSDDEKKLILESDRTEAEMRQKGVIFEDAALTAYVTGVAGPLIPAMTNGPRFHFIVIRDPTINAFSMANGGVVVHTGLLAALENEAQLAMVLGHEVAHNNLRHQLNGLHDFQAKVVTYKMIHTILGPAVAAVSGGLGLMALETMSGFTALAVVTGYQRSEEEAADLAGLHAMAAAGYESAQGPQTFQRLIEMEDYNALVTFFYGNHPRNVERHKYTQALVDDGAVPKNEGGRVAQAEFRAATRNAVEENVRLRLHARHYEYARKEVERAYGYYGETASLRYLEGEIHRLRATDPEGTLREASFRSHDDYDEKKLAPLRAQHDEELGKAFDAYSRALELDPHFYPAQRGLGEIALERGQREDARKLLDGYLDSDPNAPDYRYVERLLKRIGLEKQETPK